MLQNKTFHVLFCQKNTGTRDREFVLPNKQKRQSDKDKVTNTNSPSDPTNSQFRQSQNKTLGNQDKTRQDNSPNPNPKNGSVVGSDTKEGAGQTS